MSQIATFNFDGATIRTTTGADGEPWFVAADVCAALGIANSRDAVARLDDDEKGVATTDTLGGVEPTRCRWPRPFMPCARDACFG